MEDKYLEKFNLVKAIKKTNNTINKLQSKIVRKYNITVSQYGILECLYFNGNMCINELINKQISTSGTMTVILKNLEKLGYITKENSCTDKRYFKVILTIKGKNLVQKILPEMNEFLDEFTGVLSTKENDDLLNILYKYKNRYKYEENECE